LLKVKRESGVSKEKFEQIINGLGDYEGKIGWDSSAVYPDGTKTAYVATIQEFGDPQHNIPSRSFFRSTINAKSQSWKELNEKAARAMLKGKIFAKDGFSQLVLGAEGDFVEKITTLQNPPLKQSTIEARMRKKADKHTVGNLTKPLIDTGYMLSTLTSTVDGEIIPGSNATRRGA
jgi:hypothetical protein